MSKAIVKIDIPTDYADEYKQWLINGGLYYLEDGAWTHLKDVEYKVKPYREAIPIEWIEEWGWKNGMSESMSLRVMIDDWEKENGKTD